MKILIDQRDYVEKMTREKSNLYEKVLLLNKQFDIVVMLKPLLCIRIWASYRCT